MKRSRAYTSLAAILAATAITLSPLAPVAFAQEDTNSASSTEYFELTVPTDSNAQVWVQKDVTGGGELRVRGQGWTNTAGDGGARVTVKLQTGPGEFIPRTDNIQQHPTSGQEDSTIWAYIYPDASGDFDETLDLPAVLEAGQRLQVSVTTGFDDPNRTVLSPSLYVDGKQWQATVGETVECVPSTENAEVSVTEGPDADNRIKIVGTGFCNPTDGGSVVALKLGSRGMYSRLDDEDNISDNLSVWAVMDDEVNPETGDFEYWLTLPDGTTEKPNGSTPAFTEGEHAIIALTGSLKDDDPIRAVQTRFTYGEYQPAPGAPEPPAYDDLSDDRKQDMQFYVDGDSALVTLPHASEGDFVFFSYFLTDTSQRVPWFDWYQVDNNRQIRLDLNAITRNGTYKLVAQSGNRGEIGEVVGWQWIEIDHNEEIEQDTLPTGSGVDQGGSTYGVDNENGVAIPTGAIERSAADGDEVIIVRQDVEHELTEEIVFVEDSGLLADGTTSGTGSTGSSSGSTGSSSGGTGSTGSSSGGTGSTAGSDSDTDDAATDEDGESSESNVNRPKPDFEPEAPVDKEWRLSPNNAGEITGTANGEELVINVPGAEEGSWYFIWAYTPEATPAGWLQTDAEGQMRIDVSGLSDGTYKFAIIDEAGEFLGWTGITLATVDEDTDDDDATTTTTTNSAASTEDSGLSARDWWLIGGAIALVAAGAAATINRQRRQQ